VYTTGAAVLLADTAPYSDEAATGAICIDCIATVFDASSPALPLRRRRTRQHTSSASSTISTNAPTTPPTTARSANAADCDDEASTALSDAASTLIVQDVSV
jgi:hypothetical protein